MLDKKLGLEIKKLEVGYGDYQIIWGVDIAADKGEVVSLMGPNGSGKSTIMNSISGLLKPMRGEIWFEGQRIDTLACHKRVALGVVHVLERRRVFPYMSVEKNLLLGAWHPSLRSRREEALERVLGFFPRLKERFQQDAYFLSGGEQQMLALGRGMMAWPRLMLIDEPFLGLAPGVQAEMKDIFQAIQSEDVALLFIEQQPETALSLSDRGYVLESGRLKLSGKSEDLLGHPELKRIFLGG